jgi:hypothetical protein
MWTGEEHLILEQALPGFELQCARIELMVRVHVGLLLLIFGGDR